MGQAQPAAKTVSAGRRCREMNVRVDATIAATKTERERCVALAEAAATEWQRGSDEAESTPQGEAFRTVAAEIARQFAGLAEMIRG